MKSGTAPEDPRSLRVTSYAEVWIEMGEWEQEVTGTESPPTRRCGLKFHYNSVNGILGQVTSYAEVWIEIESPRSKNLLPSVTSYAEVWIEISTWVCVPCPSCVTSYAEVGIEMEINNIEIHTPFRHLLRGGGD